MKKITGFEGKCFIARKSKSCWTTLHSTLLIAIFIHISCLYGYAIYRPEIRKMDYQFFEIGPVIQKEPEIEVKVIESKVKIPLSLPTIKGMQDFDSASGDQSDPAKQHKTSQSRGADLLNGIPGLGVEEDDGDEFTYAGSWSKESGEGGPAAHGAGGAGPGGSGEVNDFNGIEIAGKIRDMRCLGCKIDTPRGKSIIKKTEQPQLLNFEAAVAQNFNQQPDESKSIRMELRLRVGRNGRVISSELWSASGNEDLDKAAIDWGKVMRFASHYENGKATEYMAFVPMIVEPASAVKIPDQETRVAQRQKEIDPYVAPTKSRGKEKTGPIAAATKSQDKGWPQNRAKESHKKPQEEEESFPGEASPKSMGGGKGSGTSNIIKTSIHGNMTNNYSFAREGELTILGELRYDVCGAADGLPLEDGSLRIYYDRSGVIWNALSPDGLNISEVAKKRIKPNEDEGRIAGPCVLKLYDGRYRMYYDGQKDIDGNKVSWVYSAISDDGIKFKKEGLCFRTSHNTDWAGTPSVLRIPGGAYRLYYSDVTGYIYSARSIDGRKFEDEGVEIQWGCDADVEILPDGTYFMAYTRPLIGTKSAEIWCAISNDGLTWDKGRMVAHPDEKAQIIHDPFVAVFPNGNLKVYILRDPKSEEDDHHSVLIGEF